MCIVATGRNGYISSRNCRVPCAQQCTHHVASKVHHIKHFFNHLAISTSKGILLGHLIIFRSIKKFYIYVGAQVLKKSDVPKTHLLQFWTKWVNYLRSHKFDLCRNFIRKMLALFLTTGHSTFFVRFSKFLLSAIHKPF